MGGDNCFLKKPLHEGDQYREERLNIRRRVSKNLYKLRCGGRMRQPSGEPKAGKEGRGIERRSDELHSDEPCRSVVVFSAGRLSPRQPALPGEAASKRDECHIPGLRCALGLDRLSIKRGPDRPLELKPPRRIDQTGSQAPVAYLVEQQQERLRPRSVAASTS